MDYIKDTLDNGLRVIYVPMRGTQTVTALLLVGVGSRYETKETNGISHFLEHLVFKGTAKRPDKLIVAQELDAVGAHYNAFTSDEYTGYYVKADGRHLELAVDMVADISFNATLPTEEIEKERGVILGEIVLYEDDPQAQVSYTFDELLLGDQPPGWRVLGTREAVQSLQREDFVRYREQSYVASNMVLVIAGAFDMSAAKTLVTEHFKHYKSGERPQSVPVQLSFHGPAFREGTKKFDQAHLLLGFPAYDKHDERLYAARVLKTVLGGNMSSRLFITIREELGLGYHVSADYEAKDDYGILSVDAGVDPDRLDEATGAILEELRKIQKKEIDQKELSRALEYIKGATRISLESSSSVAGWFAREELWRREREDFLTPEDFFSKLEEVTPADVKNVAQEIFTDDRLNMAVVGPVKDGEKVRSLLSFS